MWPAQDISLSLAYIDTLVEEHMLGETDENCEKPWMI
jgi:hypothetical protein